MSRNLRNLIGAIEIILIVSFNQAIAGEIHKAAADGDLEKVKALIESDPSLVNVPQEGRSQLTPLHHAIIKGHLDVVKFLISEGADLEAPNAFNSNAFSLAMQNRHEDIALWLLDHGAKVDPIGPLHDAVGCGNVNLVKIIIDKGGDVNARGNFSMTPLHNAASLGFRAIAELLIDSGANLEMISDHGSTPLGLAAADGHLEVVQLLIQRGANVNGGTRKTPLQYAADRCFFDIAKFLLDKGAVIDVKLTPSDNTPLILAAAKGCYAVVELLIVRGADVNAHGDLESTSLYKASENGNANVVKLLLDNGAFVNDQSPLLRAAYSNHFEAAKILVEYGADINVENQNLGSPLIWAAIHCNGEMVKYLVEEGAKVNFIKQYGRETALHFSAACSLEITEYLINRGAEINAGKPGETPIYYAAHSNRAEIAELLIANGAEINIKEDFSGDTPLLNASGPEVSEVLLKHGADPNKTNIHGDTPLQKAIDKGDSALIEILLWYGADPEGRIGTNNITPLHLAASFNHPDIILQLLLYGADPDPLSNDGMTPLLFLTSNNDSCDSAELLVNWGADVMARDSLGRTPLHRAAAGERLACIETLLSQGADVNSRDYQGNTPIDLARANRYEKAVKKILQYCRERQVNCSE